MVTDCLKEVVVAFRKLLFEEKNCELPFSKIGKLQIKNKKVTMKFYQEFLDKRNQNWKNRMDNEKIKLEATQYDPDWDADQYEYPVYLIGFCSTILIFIFFSNIEIAQNVQNEKFPNTDIR